MLKDSTISRIVISIHAPREGSDVARGGRLCSAWNFNPRSPRGERQQMCIDF